MNAFRLKKNKCSGMFIPDWVIMYWQASVLDKCYMYFFFEHLLDSISFCDPNQLSSNYCPFYSCDKTEFESSHSSTVYRYKSCINLASFSRIVGQETMGKISSSWHFFCSFVLFFLVYFSVTKLSYYKTMWLSNYFYVI